MPNDSISCSMFNLEIQIFKEAFWLMNVCLAFQRFKGKMVEGDIPKLNVSSLELKDLGVGFFFDLRFLV